GVATLPGSEPVPEPAKQQQTGRVGEVPRRVSQPQRRRVALHVRSRINGVDAHLPRVHGGEECFCKETRATPDASRRSASNLSPPCFREHGKRGADPAVGLSTTMAGSWRKDDEPDC